MLGVPKCTEHPIFFLMDKLRYLYLFHLVDELSVDELSIYDQQGHSSIAHWFLASNESNHCNDPLTEVPAGDLEYFCYPLKEEEKLQDDINPAMGLKKRLDPNPNNIGHINTTQRFRERESHVHVHFSIFGPPRGSGQPFLPVLLFVFISIVLPLHVSALFGKYTKGKKKKLMFDVLINGNRDIFMLCFLGNMSVYFSFRD
ncbi:hypothetical protein ACJX0J_010941 [Zea mays]